jgi:hypothetical protein
MTDNDIAKMVAEMYPSTEKNGAIQKDYQILANRLAAMKAAKKVRDHYEQKISFIHLTEK